MQSKKIMIIDCGEPMTKLETGTVEASVEKHVPKLLFIHIAIYMVFGCVKFRS